MRVKKYISFGLVILILFTSCSNSLLEGLTNFTSALNNNLFVDSTLSEAELEKLNNAVSTQLLTGINGENSLKLISSLPVSTYNNTEISVTLTLPTELNGAKVAVLAPLSSSDIDSLLLLVGNRKKAEQFASYMKTPIADEKTKETLDKLDVQKKKYGISTRNDYLRLLVEIDLLTDILETIKDKKSKLK